jgi:hypothetical protein
LFSAQSIAQVILWLILTSVAGLAGFGTVGDILLIIERVTAPQMPDE